MGSQVIDYRLSFGDDRPEISYSLDDVDSRSLARRLVNEPSQLPGSSPRGAVATALKFGALGLLGALDSLVSVNWLSVDRTLSLERWRDGRSYESAIDLRLESLSNKMVRFFSKVAQERDDAIQDFHQKVLLSFIEFPADSTTRLNIKKTTLEDVKKIASILKKTFRDAKIEDSLGQTYLNDFVDRAANALEKFSTLMSERERSAGAPRQREAPSSDQLKIFNDFFMVSQKIIDSSKVAELASNLQEKLDSISFNRNLFIQTANQLYLKKELIINDSNEILFRTTSGKTLAPQALSSGEKQMLVLLSEMFLQDSRRSIMIADEPELSLHLHWQEKLIASLKNLNPHGQLIVATHSPDVVGLRTDRVTRVNEIIA
jgi:predicted ATP-dependent endonuclease of OLD family